MENYSSDSSNLDVSSSSIEIIEVPKKTPEFISIESSDSDPSISKDGTCTDDIPTEVKESQFMKGTQKSDPGSNTLPYEGTALEINNKRDLVKSKKELRKFENKLIESNSSEVERLSRSGYSSFSMKYYAPKKNKFTYEQDQGICEDRHIVSDRIAKKNIPVKRLKGKKHIRDKHKDIHKEKNKIKTDLILKSYTKALERERKSKLSASSKSFTKDMYSNEEQDFNALTNRISKIRDSLSNPPSLTKNANLLDEAAESSKSVTKKFEMQSLKYPASNSKVQPIIKHNDDLILTKSLPRHKNSTKEQSYRIEEKEFMKRTDNLRKPKKTKKMKCPIIEYVHRNSGNLDASEISNQVSEDCTLQTEKCSVQPKSNIALSPKLHEHSKKMKKSKKKSASHKKYHENKTFWKNKIKKTETNGKNSDSSKVKMLPTQNFSIIPQMDECIHQKKLKKHKKRSKIE